MKEIAESSWYLFISIAATLLGVVTGTATVIGLLRAIVSKLRDRRPGAIPQEATPISRLRSLQVLQQRYSRGAPRRSIDLHDQDTQLNICAFIGAVVGTLLGLAVPKDHVTSFVALLLFWPGCGLLGAFCGLFVGAAVMAVIETRKETKAARFALQAKLAKLRPLRKAVEAAPSSREALHALGGELLHIAWELRRRERRTILDEAIRAFQREVELGSEDGHAWFSLGQALEAADRDDEAVVAFERARQFGSWASWAEEALQRLERKRRQGA